ncbi:MAG: adenylate/guanylate cyclase domain-containing protein [Armatimonadota bacterium]|nr:PAS domain S-box protein [Armatimonadota bacterium]MCX7777774.1 PAS domain S-box protein [Armatimonadota bacterium]MDW8025339.1 adenylate/guanylate cyclase domain-containing protein [Armatimonadota bacterium]
MCSDDELRQALGRLAATSSVRRLLEFFIRNPHVIDTPSGLAQWTGEDEGTIAEALSALGDLGVVRRIGDAELYAFNAAKNVRLVIEDVLHLLPTVIEHEDEKELVTYETHVEAEAKEQTAHGIAMEDTLGWLTKDAIEALNASQSPSGYLRSLSELFSNLTGVSECAFLVRSEMLSIPEIAEAPAEPFIVSLQVIGDVGKWLLKSAGKLTADALSEIAQQGCRVVSFKGGLSYPFTRLHGLLSQDVECAVIAPVVISGVVAGIFIARCVSEEVANGLLKTCELLVRLAGMGIRYWQWRLKCERVSSYTRNLLESVNVGVVALDSEGHITTFNTASERIFCLPAAQAIGMHFKDVLGGAFNPRLVGLIEKALEFGESASGVELEYINQFGQTKILSARVAPLKDEHNNAIGAVLMADDITEITRRREALYRVLPRHVADRIMDNPASLVSGGVRKRITVLFADMHGFTTISERLTPEQVVDLLNAFLPLLASITFQYEGTVDKFLGDGVMAFFGAPESHEDDAWRAVKAAWDMRQSVADFARGKSSMGLRFITVGIGINTGDAIVGYIGSERVRVEFTAVGDTVNVAKRLQEMAIGDQILLSDTTYELVRDRVIVRELGPVTVSGRRKPVFVFQLEGLR